jgi:hypothetical protein
MGRTLLAEHALVISHLVSGQALLVDRAGTRRHPESHGTPVAIKGGVRIISVLNQVNFKVDQLRPHPLVGWKDRDDKAISSSLYDVDSHHDAGICIGGRFRLRAILALPFS